MTITKRASRAVGSSLAALLLAASSTGCGSGSSPSPTAMWTTTPSGVLEDLQAIWGSGPGDAWAVGTNGTILHFNGTQWARVPASPTREHLFGVWGSGSSDVWAVGNGVVLRWDGSTWRAVDPGVVLPWHGVWGSGPNDVWIVGSGVDAIVHWNGLAWSRYILGGSMDASTIWGSGPNDVWVADWGAGSDGLHWDGTVWGYHVVGGTAGQRFDGVGGSGPADVLMVGSQGAYHFNGTAWAATPGYTGTLFRVWSISPTLAIGVGGFGTLQRWDGSSWVSESSPTTQNLWGVWAPSASTAWAVGSGGIILRRQ